MVVDLAYISNIDYDYILVFGTFQNSPLPLQFITVKREIDNYTRLTKEPGKSNNPPK